MKAYKIEVYVLDFEEYDAEFYAELIVNNKYIPCTSVRIVREIDIGEWDDDHPLNNMETDVEQYFNEKENIRNSVDAGIRNT